MKVVSFKLVRVLQEYLGAASVSPSSSNLASNNYENVFY